VVRKSLSHTIEEKPIGKITTKRPIIGGDKSKPLLAQVRYYLDDLMTAVKIGQTGTSDIQREFICRTGLVFPLLNSSILDQECDLLDDLNERLTCPGESGF